jgi:hypothetical protein
MFMSFRLDLREPDEVVLCLGTQLAAAPRPNRRLRATCPSAGPAACGVRRAGGGHVLGSLERIVSNRQAETMGRSVRSEKGTLRSRGGAWACVGSHVLFLGYRGHVLMLQRPNSLVFQAYRSGDPWLRAVYRRVAVGLFVIGLVA